MDETNTPTPETANSDKAKRLKLWKDRISRAKKLREDWENEYKVKELENYYLGKQAEHGERVFNHFLATLKAELPELYFTNPTFMVRSQPGKSSPADETQVARAEGVLQSIAAHDDNLEMSGELATMQLYFRIGVLKTIYDPALEPNPQAGKPIFQHLADGSPVLDDQTQEPVPLIDPQTGGPLVEPDFIVSDEVYRWEWVDAKKMLLPDEGPDQRKWSWLGEEIIVPLEQAKADDRFPAELRTQFKSNVSRDPTKDKERSITDPEDDALFKYCECYEIRQKRWYIYADGQDFDEFLIDSPIPAGIEDHPYSILNGFNPIMGPEPSPWPLPEVSSWRPIQAEYNTRRNQITEGCGRSARKVYYDESTFYDETAAIGALQSSKDMEAVKLNSTTKPPVTVPDPGQTPDLFADVTLLQNDWLRVTGQTSANLGSPDSRTATEATFAQRASNARTIAKRNMIIRWMRSAGKKMLQLVQQTMTVDKWVMIRGLNDLEVQKYAQEVYGINPVMLQMLPNIKDILVERLAKQIWVPVTREELIFEATVDVIPGSVRPRTLDLERQEWLELLKIVGTFPQLLLSRELLQETATKYETITPKMIDELVALGPRMMMAAQATAGRQGDNSQGGGAGPTPEQNTLTAMAGSVQ
jgi:hypothetical protein